MNGFTVQAAGEGGSERASRWRRILFPILIAVVMVGGVVGLGAYRQYRESLRKPWLEAQSLPPGATVFLNGRWAGATPLRLEELDEGIYALRFEKQGHEPLLRQVELDKPGVRVTVDLQLATAGRLVVSVEPKGAEVLLDGLLVGHTPLTLDAVTTGPHELVVRRTNFQPYVRRLDLKANETQTFAGVALQDLILKAMQDRRKMEPWRISNATELATYLFLSGQQTAAAEMVMQAIDVAVRPPDFPQELLPDDRANEQRLRGDDVGRLNHMLGRIWSWPGKDTAQFRGRMEKSDGSLKLLAFRLQLQDRGTALHTAQQILAGSAQDAVTLSSAVRLIAERREQLKEHEYEPLLKTAEQMAQKAYGVDRSLGALAMADFFAARGASVESLKYVRECLTQTSPENAWEDRALRAAALLQALGQRDEARQLCERLSKSAREEIRKPAASLASQLK